MFFIRITKQDYIYSNHDNIIINGCIALVEPVETMEKD